MTQTSQPVCQRSLFAECWVCAAHRTQCGLALEASLCSRIPHKTRPAVRKPKLETTRPQPCSPTSHFSITCPNFQHERKHVYHSESLLNYSRLHWCVTGFFSPTATCFGEVRHSAAEGAQGSNTYWRMPFLEFIQYKSFTSGTSFSLNTARRVLL